MKVLNTICFIVLLLATPVFAAQLVNVTGNNVELTQVSVDCSAENEIGVVVSGTGFVGKQISVLDCAGGAYSFAESATLTNSLGISAGADITIAIGKTVTGTYNLFGDTSDSVGDGTYTPDANTKWSEVYADRIDNGVAIDGLHTSGSYLITGDDACGNSFLYGSGIDIGACEQMKRLDGTPSLAGGALDDDPIYYRVP